MSTYSLKDIIYETKNNSKAIGAGLIGLSALTHSGNTGNNSSRFDISKRPEPSRPEPSRPEPSSQSEHEPYDRFKNIRKLLADQVKRRKEHGPDTTGKTWSTGHDIRKEPIGDDSFGWAN